MDWKNFFKPTIFKLAIFIALILFSYYFEYAGPRYTDTSITNKGLPLPYYTKSMCAVPCVTAEDRANGINVKIAETYNYPFLVIDAVLIYLISASVVLVFQKFKK